MTTNTIICTFWGRIEPGKGIEQFVEYCDQLLQNSHHHRVFHFFGTGNIEPLLITKQKIYPEQIILHGRASWDIIKPVAQSGHYCLCRSEIIESFGLSALEGVKIGLPIIGPAKGGLQQFIIQDFQQHHSLVSILTYIDQYHDTSYTQRKQETYHIASQYGHHQWLDQFKQLL